MFDDLQQLLGYRGVTDGRTGIVEVASDLYVVPCWTPQFCELVVRAAEAVGVFEPQPDDPVPGHDGAFHVNMAWGDTVVLDPETDGGIVERGQVAVTYLTRLVHEDRDDIPVITAALDALLTR